MAVACSPKAIEKQIVNYAPRFNGFLGFETEAFGEDPYFHDSLPRSNMDRYDTWSSISGTTVSDMIKNDGYVLVSTELNIDGFNLPPPSSYPTLDCWNDLCTLSELIEQQEKTIPSSWMPGYMFGSNESYDAIIDYRYNINKFNQGRIEYIYNGETIYHATVFRGGSPVNDSDPNGFELIGNDNVGFPIIGQLKSIEEYLGPLSCYKHSGFSVGTGYTFILSIWTKRQESIHHKTVPWGWYQFEGHPAPFNFIEIFEHTSSYTIRINILNTKLQRFSEMRTQYPKSKAPFAELFASNVGIHGQIWSLENMREQGSSAPSGVFIPMRVVNSKSGETEILNIEIPLSYFGTREDFSGEDSEYARLAGDRLELDSTYIYALASVAKTSKYHFDISEDDNIGDDIGDKTVFPNAYDISSVYLSSGIDEENTLEGPEVICERGEYEYKMSIKSSKCGGNPVINIKYEANELIYGTDFVGPLSATNSDKICENGYDVIIFKVKVFADFKEGQYIKIIASEDRS